MPTNTAAAKKARQDDQAKRDANDRDISDFFTKNAGKAQPRAKAAKTQEDDDFMAGLLGEVDTNIPAPAPRLPKHDRSGERRKARFLSPAPEPAQKRRKSVDPRLASSPPPAVADHDDDEGHAPLPMDEEPMSTADVPMSDPAPSSPAAKVAERKALIKEEPKDDDDIEEDMMEVAHAGTIKADSVNMTGSRPVKKILKQDPYPSPASSSPVKAPDSSVDSSEWNQLNDRLNVVNTGPDTRTVGKIDHNDAVEPDGSLHFFWTDYTEINGSLCLFGKVLNKKTNTYVSAFVKVDNILRKLFFLPRQKKVRDGVETDEDVEMMDVYSEVDEMMTKMNVGMYKIKACTRKYAFELPDVPKEAQYMKLLYPYTSEYLQPSWSTSPDPHAQPQTNFLT